MRGEGRGERGYGFRVWVGDGHNVPFDSILPTVYWTVYTAYCCKTVISENPITGTQHILSETLFN
jgi:hypothetical protein